MTGMSARRPVRRHADAEKADAQGLRHFAHLRQMRHQLRTGLMHIFDRRAGEFELSARLQRDGAAAGDVEHADDVLALHDRLPAEDIVQAFQQRADRALALIRHGTIVRDGEGELLVLGAGPELCLRLAACFEPGDEFVARLDRRHIDLVTSHKGVRQKGRDLKHGKPERAMRDGSEHRCRFVGPKPAAGCDRGRHAHKLGDDEAGHARRRDAGKGIGKSPRDRHRRVGK